jgi:two-component system phosphate regulon sensor histidine kinase PhoR
MQTTVDTFVGEYTLTIERQTARLEGFNRLVSHELRQPLSALTSAVGVLRKRMDVIDGTNLQTVVDLVQRNVDRLTELTNKLATLSRLRTEEDNPQIQRVELAAVAGDVVRQLKDMAEARRVEIRVSDALPEVTVDVGRLELILINLISNAIKYSDPNASSRFVEIAPADAEDGCVAITVRDNGIGIERVHLPSVFDRFYRAHTPREGDPSVDGLGLGLAIVNDCVRSIGGRITVNSTPTRGTTFLVTIPTSPPLPIPSHIGL